MRVLIACEYSGRVRDAFIARGHSAMSCDILPSDAPGPHYQGDVRDVLGDGWDLVVAHPPCTYLSVSGMHWTKRGLRDPRLTEDALDFVRLLIDAPAPLVAVENPRWDRSRDGGAVGCGVNYPAAFSACTTAGVTPPCFFSSMANAASASASRITTAICRPAARTFACRSAPVMGLECIEKVHGFVHLDPLRKRGDLSSPAFPVGDAHYPEQPAFDLDGDGFVASARARSARCLNDGRSVESGRCVHDFLLFVEPSCAVTSDASTAVCRVNP